MARSRRAAPLVIGVTGHRNIAEQERALARLVRAECLRLRRAHPGRSFVVLSPLAEGADRLVARIAMQILDARLVVPLPLPLDHPDGYLKDFASSIPAFRRLLAKADEVFAGPARVLDKRWHAYGTARDRQYAWAGAYVAERADVLFALWDGKPSRGLGGTAQVVRWYLTGKVPRAFATRPAQPRSPKRRNRTLVHFDTGTGAVAHLPAA
jgi:hypothetical protein